MAQKDSQEKLLQFRALEARLEGLMRNREMLAGKIAEIEGTLATVEEIGKSNGETKFHIGDGVFVPAKPSAEGNIFVTIGADVAMEKSSTEAKSLLETRRAEANNIMRQLQQEIENLAKRLEQMVPEIEAAQGQ